jgi:transposase
VIHRAGHQAHGQDLHKNLNSSASCALKPLQRLAKGLFDNYAAVKASLMSGFSNGPVEGVNNKLKMLKRQMYGRANL